MKRSVQLFLLSMSTSASAFVAHKTVRSTNLPVAPLEAKKNKAWCVVAGAFAGWTLATKIATASVTTVQHQPDIGVIDGMQSIPTTVISEGAYIPEAGYDSLDMSLPSYNLENNAAAKTVEGVSNVKPKKQSKPSRVARKKKEVDPEKAAAAKAKAEEKAAAAKAKAEEKAAAKLAKKEADLEKTKEIIARKNAKQQEIAEQKARQDAAKAAAREKMLSR